MVQVLVEVTVFQVCFKRCNRKMSTNRGALWSDCEVRALIAVWGESNVQEELDGAVRNKVVFVAISDKLLQQGYNRDWQQCRTKVKNLIQSRQGPQWGNRKRKKNMQFHQWTGHHSWSPASFNPLCVARHGNKQHKSSRLPRWRERNKW